MADRRKLQGEIDRCLKKVAEGVDTFEDIWKKVHNATNTNQKEKYEADLKKEIKKLQRLRDQIKTWCASSEIKDKRQLVDNRKLIETQMERFKVVERETKTKAYSKEGLGAAQKLDPVQKEKEEVNNWLSASIDTLSVQVDQFESEIEALQIVQKKSKKDRDKLERNEFLKKRLEKHRFHIKQLETLMRMLDNETVEVDQIKKIKDDIEYYIESSQEADFLDNEYIYDDLDMEDMIAFRANNVVDSTNAALTKSSSTTSATGKSEANNSSATGSVENEDINAQSNSSSANESPAPSPSLLNSHSSKTTTNSCTNEFAFITGNSSPTTTTLTTAASSNKTVWSSSTTASRGGTSVATNLTTSPAAPVVSANSSAKSDSTTTTSAAAVAATSTTTNDTRSQAMNSSALSETGANHLPSNNSTATVTLYSAAAASASSSVTSTASVSNPWNTTISGSNALGATAAPEMPNHQILGSRQLSAANNGAQIPLSAQQQQQMLLQQQQQNNHLLNGFKASEGNPNISTLKSLAQQSVGSAEIDEHFANSMMNSINMGLSNMGLQNSNNSNSVNQMPHMNEMSTSGQSSNNLNNEIHNVDHSNMFKNNLLIHQQNQLMQDSTPSSSVSPPNNLNSNNAGGNSGTNNNSTGNNNNGGGGNINANNISNAEGSLNVSSSINSTSQNQSQMFYQPFTNPVSKNLLPKSLMFNIQLLEAAFRYPIIPMDSHRSKAITKLAPPCSASTGNCSFPSQILPQFDNLDFYQRLGNEALFFIFYYMEGTKAQYMAAKTLKKQSWRFHTKFMMWFQRLEEPKSITEDFEQGTYIYFDYERWEQRKRDGFTFEYKYLEDKDFV